jgi:non-heme chloroperoxidase
VLASNLGIVGRSLIFRGAAAERLAATPSTIEANGTSLAYVEAGEGDPVVFVHGAFVDYRSWQFQIDAFARRYRAIAYSRRHAYPNQPAGDRSDDSIETNASDLKELLDQLRTGPAHLVSVTTGSTIVLTFARRHPELVRSLTVADPSVSGLLIRNPKSRLSLLGFLLTHPFAARAMTKTSRVFRSAREALARGETREAASRLVEGLQGDDPRFPSNENGPQTLFDRIPTWIQTMFLDNIDDLKATPNPSGDRRFSPDDARAIRTRALLVKAERFRPLNPFSDALARLLPNCEVVTIPGVGADYGRWLEPYPFNDAVLGFLYRVT